MSGRHLLLCGGIAVWLCCLSTGRAEAQKAIDGDRSNGFLLQNALNIQQVMSHLGNPLSPEDSETLNQLKRRAGSADAGVEFAIQRLLDPYCIAVVEIEHDGSLTVKSNAPVLELQQGGWKSYLVNVTNHSRYSGRLRVKSPNSEPLFVETRGQTRMMPEEMFTLKQLDQRFLALSLFRNAPLHANLSGHPVEYAILQIYSRKSGRLQADLDFYLADYYKDMRLVESSFLKPPAETNATEGLKGEYFANTTLSGEPVLERIDKEINFEWKNEVAPGSALDQEHFSTRWTGSLIVPKSGRYRLGVRSNDGTRLYLDGKLIISNWALQGTTLRTAEVNLKQDQSHGVKVEYFQGGGSADVRLEWDDGPLNPTRIRVLFEAAPAVPVLLHVIDDDGSPTMASFIFTDGVERYERLPQGHNAQYGQTLNHGLSDYDRRAQREYEYYPADLKGIYPLPSKRLALIDPYPDQYFHAQVYREDGEYVLLPPGQFRVAFTRGPEYVTKTRTITVPRNTPKHQETFRLKRWVSMRQHGYYSSDSHIHASGCCYSTNPEEGLKPDHIWRFQRGEDLNIANVLNWVGNWYHQKSYFTGHDHPHSDHDHLLRYNVEVSGFPSSHAGHVVLLGLHEDDYPDTSTIEDWPTWNLPILKWAKAQNALTGYAHSGWGLTPMNGTWDLPNYEIPRMNDIGANEFIVTVTEGVVDFYSVGDTPVTWELNMWYHSLNCGFRPRLSGETDYPCIYDERVGEARSYVKLDYDLNYDQYLDGIRRGSGYVSDGRSHFIDFSADEIKLGTEDSLLKLSHPRRVKVSAKVAALLAVEQSEIGQQIAASSLDRQPYWHIERSRIGSTRDLTVELVINGIAVDSKTVTADGDWKDVSFEPQIDESCWLALRIFPCAHTNPIFVSVEGQPILNHRSAKWSRRALDQCWKMKKEKISDTDLPDAVEAFDRARAVYDRLIDDSR